MKQIQDATYHVSPGKAVILLAVYNGADYLMEQLASLEHQTFRNFICFIHDDGSTDGSQDLISEYCRIHPDHFVDLGSSRTGGAKYNFMYMLQRVDADYIMFCDQDDVWLPEKIEKTCRVMQEALTDAQDLPAAVYTDLYVVDEKLNVLSNSVYAFSGTNPDRDTLYDLLNQNLAVGCTMMINRRLREIGLMQDVTEQMNMHDWYLMLLARCLGKVIYLNEPTVYYRQHTDNAIGVGAARGWGTRILGVLRGPKAFLKVKKNALRDQRGNAQAVLTILSCLGYGEEDENVRLLRHAEKQYASFFRGMRYFYRWKYAK